MSGRFAWLLPKIVVAGPKVSVEAAHGRSCVLGLAVRDAVRGWVGDLTCILAGDEAGSGGQQGTAPSRGRPSSPAPDEASEKRRLTPHIAEGQTCRSDAVSGFRQAGLWPRSSDFVVLRWDAAGPARTLEIRGLGPRSGRKGPKGDTRCPTPWQEFGHFAGPYECVRLAATRHRLR